MPSRLRTSLASTAAAVVGILALAGPALGSSTQVTIAQDDRALFTDGRQADTLEFFRASGVDWVRINVRWDVLAPDAESRTRPTFDDRDPNQYDDSDFLRLDRAIRGVEARGMQVLLTPTAPAPRWASEGGRSKLWKPSATLFGNFVHALGVRYNGAFAPQGGDGVAPRVSRWSIWNEPNQPGWLQPQFVAGSPFAPHLYRSLFRAARTGLATSGHSRDRVLLGETAPLGDRGRSTRSKMTPGRFIRELFCLGSRAPVCRRSFSRLRASGFAHHPYVKFRSQKPTSRPSNRDEFPVGATARLVGLLDRAGRAGRVTRGLGVFMTEFGWQTNPPDRLLGVSPRRQAQFINESERLFYYNGRVKAYGQYLFFDDEGAPGGFQTGLRYADGRVKPAYDAFRTALVVKGRSRRTLTVWGHVRSAGSGQRVELQFRSRGRFRTVRTLTTRRGYVITSRPRRSGQWRLRWTDSAGAVHFSRAAST